MKCLLCKLDKLTYWHYETDDFVICDCKTCRVPMLVWREHDFPSSEKQLELIKFAQQMFPNKKFDGVRKAIKDHYHFHMR